MTGSKKYLTGGHDCEQDESQPIWPCPCDVHPSEDIYPAIRNHVTLAIDDGLNPSQLALEFFDHLNLQNEQRVEHQTEFNTTEVEDFVGSAFFEFSWYDDRIFHDIYFHWVNDNGNTLHIHYPIKNNSGDSFDSAVGGVLSSWLDLNADRYKNQRWYADHDWPKRDDPQPAHW